MLLALPSGERDRLVVFGYGSLIWRPNIPYTRRWVGYIKGYLRRFYQRNIVHRGTPNTPGRVATLVRTDKPDARVWGSAYEVVGQDNVKAALDHLLDREVLNGGYRVDLVPFHPIAKDLSKSSQLNAWIFVNSFTRCPEVSLNEDISHVNEIPLTDFYLGEAPLEEQATQIVSARGICGSNSEYVLLIAAFMRTEVPGDYAFRDDPYIFEMEQLIRQKLFGCKPDCSQSEMGVNTDLESVIKRQVITTDFAKPDDLIKAEGKSERFAKCFEPQATQIVSARGICGSNSEYVLLIAAFMRTEVPGDYAFRDDPYIFEMEQLIRQKLFGCKPDCSQSEMGVNTDLESVIKRQVITTDFAKPDDLIKAEGKSER
ncbi:unnamed protein product [Calicophoron daubneyi]|uniref:glutathione-specific gamma-glutamylcyclotransferase n=1 Tax=Calicophoron daubneyi TaxID=300641 RepID=A0AAV2TM17_CALDB